MSSTLVSLHPRINLSPFTKDFRGEEQYNESIDLFLKPCTKYRVTYNEIRTPFVLVNS